MRLSGTPTALILGAAITAVWTWWAWKQGAYFGTVMLPGTVGLLGLAAVALLAAPLAIRLRGAPAVALGALAGIALLITASLLWTPTRDVASEDAARAAAYAVAFFLGIVLCHLLGKRLQLASLPVAVAAGLVGLATVKTIGTGHELTAYVHADYTLRYPFGYRNGNAAFFLIALWPALAIALEWSRDWRLRAAMFATAVLCAELAVLCQSRGSVLAIVPAILVFVVASPRRGLAVVGLVAVAVPVAICLPWLLDVYRVHDDASALAALHSAARVVAIATAAAFVVGLALSRLKIPPFLDVVARPLGPKALAAAVGLAVVTIAAAFAISDPIARVSDKVDEFTAGGYTSLSQSTRFGTNTSSNRSDFWRVAADEFGDHPLLGDGSGGFRFAYLQQRDSTESPEDPHSIEALMASELGIAGLALFATFAVAAGRGARPRRDFEPRGAGLSAAALAAGAYWLTQGSVDWLWSYPGLTAPTIFLLGAAAAPTLREQGYRSARGIRVAAAGVLAVAALAAVPLFFSDRYLQFGLGADAADPAAARTDFDRAASFNPFAAEPLLAEASLAEGQGQTARAAAAYRRAIGREPENWVTHYLLGALLAPTDRAASRAELERALQLNPRDPRIAAALGLPEAANG